MKSLQRLVVAVLLGVWCFPAVSLAEPLAKPPAEVGSRASANASPAQSSTQTEESALGAREKQSQDLQDFKGGGVYIYLGGGATLILVIILLILIL
jgi:hypothetical protein